VLAELETGAIPVEAEDTVFDAVDTCLAASGAKP
jgi:hypothetical protein